MIRRIFSLVILATSSSTGFTADGPAKLSFNRDIRPIFAEYCTSCHGPGKKNGGLRIDLEGAVKKGGKSGIPTVVAGKPEESELLKRIHSTDATEVMPPPKTNKVLKDEEKARLKEWIAQGAPFEGHWAFEPIRKNSKPSAGDILIDRHILARLSQSGQGYRPEASRETLIRRVSFTLTGLPPTVSEVDQFVRDTGPGAYERMVDRYFTSARHGEEMARHWLDLARYADTHGLHLDNERQMWAYRDWVVKAFNTNLPFDQFTIDQIAGDLLPNPTLDQKVATGFSRCNVTTGEGGSIDAEWIYRNAVERASTVFTAWLGMTGGCAQCHDHKFDPITAKDFYGFYAFFHSAADPALDGNALLTAPTVKLETEVIKKRRAALQSELDGIRSALAASGAKAPYSDPATGPEKNSPKTTEDIWFEDSFPSGRVFASPGHPTEYVDAKSGKVFSGSKAIKRKDAGLTQDVIEGMPTKTIPAGAKLFSHDYIESFDKPKTLMLQYFKGGWLHRAAWGDYDTIPWGKPGSTEKVNVGPLPEAGKWVKLEIDAGKLGLNAGDQITGFALTQHGGTVFWDKVGVSGTSDPASDPKQSLLAWWKSQKGKDAPDAPVSIAGWIKEGPEAKRTESEKNQVKNYYVSEVWQSAPTEVVDQRVRRQSKQAELAKLDGDLPGSFVFADLPQPRQSFVMMRGQYDKPGEKVDPSTPGFLPPIRGLEKRRGNRLDLAKWLVSDDQPLVPRVVVNRFWQQVFGTGLVKSSGDFGTQGEMPSHPELLDELADQFRSNGWNVRELLRAMIVSRAFRQGSEAPESSWKEDPENRLLGRGPRLRLDAEQIRDNALFVSGLIRLDMGGKGSMPYQPANIWEPVGFVGSNTRSYQQSKGDDLYRRSIYVFLKRTAPAPFMSNFDAPNRETPCTRRERSNTPLQALQLMNDVQHVEAARGLATKLLESGSHAADRVRFGFRTVLSRNPNSREEQALLAFLEREQARYQADPIAAGKLIRVGESAIAKGTDEPTLAAYTLLANLILNLDETVNRN
jgi:hypothetical protein